MSVTEEIKARLDLVSYVIENGVPLKKAGRSYKARCPFHQERTPSFVVFPETQTWRCFGACGEGGDLFAFAMKQHGWDFGEALRNLAQRAGVELEPRTPEQAERQEAFERLLSLLDETARFFHEQLLASPEAEGARAYVAGRGLKPETVETFLLGYAPGGWHASLDHLKGLGYGEGDILAAGVAARNEQGRVYDRFRERLMIPIRDGRGRVIGFGARALRPEDQPKYLNSPQTDLFDKSSTLFGWDLARREIRESETAIIVEGYMDVMQAHQAGFRNVVAQMGTALTEPQLQLLRRYASRLILAFDPDQAGISATMRGLDVARQSLDEASTALFGRGGSMRQASRLGIDVHVLSLPPGQDPDDLIREQPDEWRRRVDGAEPVADYVIRVGTADLDPRATSSLEKEKVARALLPILTATESDLHKEANVQKLALALHLPEKRLMEIALEVRAAVARPRPTSPRVRQRRRTAAMDQARAAPPPAPPSAPLSAPDRPVEDTSWEEGPRLAAQEVPLLDDEDSEGAPPLPSETKFPPETTFPQVQPRYRLSPASAEERYCLGLLLRRPELLYQANRALRMVAEVAVAATSNEARQADLWMALSPLSAEDFQDAAHQAILRALQAALAQDAVEPLEHVRMTLEGLLRLRLDELLLMPLETLEAALPASLRPELPSVRRQLRREGRALAEPEAELADRMLDLRRERLRRANEELRFVLQETDDLTGQPYWDTLHANEIAIRHLDEALQRQAHRQTMPPGA